jgi:hypothetical protein
LQFFGAHQALTERKAFIAYLAPLLKLNWYVHIKAPFAGPEAVLDYLGRYTHRVALANSRLIAYDRHHVTFWHKDYRGSKEVRYQPMTLDVDEFIRRFLLHVLPKGFHRIRHYGLLASHVRAGHLAKIRAFLDVEPAEIEPSDDPSTNDTPSGPYRCHDCGGEMVIVETFTPASRDPPVHKAA